MAARELYVIPNGFVRDTMGVVSSEEPLPVAVYLIRTDDGNILFDSGMNPLVISDPKKAWGGMAKIFQPIMTEENHPLRALRQIGLGPEDIDYVVISHLHFDHAGGIQLFPSAKIVVQTEEYRSAIYADYFTRGGYRKLDLNFPNFHWELIEGDEILVPGVTLTLTHGHTLGHQSMIVDLLETGTIILSSDAAYTMENIEKLTIPGIAVNSSLAFQAIKRIKVIALRSRGQIFPGHDPVFWKSLKKCPQFYG